MASYPDSVNSNGHVARSLTRLTALYPNSYVWFVFVSAMDIMLTWLIKEKGGTEVNPIANWVIENWYLTGAIVFKFGLVVFVIMICEFVGRRERRTGLALAIFAACISAVPVVYSLSLLVGHYWFGWEPAAAT